MRKSALWLAVGLSLGFAPAPLPRPESKKHDLKKLQGTWVRVLCTQGGQQVPIPPTPPGFPLALQVVISGDCMTYLHAGSVQSEWAITLMSPGKGPKVFDVKGVRATAGQYRGVYRLEGDTLTLCSHPSSAEKDRPTDLNDSRPGVVLEVFQRVKR